MYFSSIHVVLKLCSLGTTIILGFIRPIMWYTGREERGDQVNINTDNLVSMTEANQNFSKVARMVNESGSVIVLKNNVPRYLIIDFSKASEERLAADEDVSVISRRPIAKNKSAYKELAQ